MYCAVGTRTGTREREGQDKRGCAGEVRVAQEAESSMSTILSDGSSVPPASPVQAAIVASNFQDSAAPPDEPPPAYDPFGHSLSDDDSTPNAAIAWRASAVPVEDTFASILATQKKETQVNVPLRANNAQSSLRPWCTRTSGPPISNLR